MKHVVVGKLYAVLYVDESGGGVVRAHHASFYDFLEHRANDTNSGWENLKTTHSNMFLSCIDMLHSQLRFNICSIEKPVLNKDIPDLAERISKNMSEELQYSSCFWYTHLALSNLDSPVALPGISKLLCSWKLLFWLETLSLQSQLGQSLQAFATCNHFFQASTRVFSWIVDISIFGRNIAIS